MKVDSDPVLSNQQDEALSRLMGVLLQQERICGDLLEVAASEAVATVDGQVDTLERLVREKSNLIDKIEALEKKRLEASAGLATLLGLERTASLADLAASMDNPNAADLRLVRQRVLDTLQKLRDSNDSNLLLMKKSLELVRDSIRNLRRGIGSESYGADGSLVASAASLGASTSVDCRV